MNRYMLNEKNVSIIIFILFYQIIEHLIFNAIIYYHKDFVINA